MLTTRDLRDRLPAFRRHCFLLTGSRTAADAALAIAIARLPRDKAGRPCAESPVAAYQALGDAARRVVCPVDGRLQPLHERLMTLPAETRRVLVLRVIDRLPPADIAEICDLTPDEVRAVVLEARDGLTIGGLSITRRARA